MEEMKVTITTLSPVVLTTRKNSPVMTETNDYFSGTVLRGIFAGQYIKAQGLGDKAHEDEEFMRAFFGHLRFVDAYPQCQDQRAFVLPLSMQKDKTGALLMDLATEKPKAGYKSLKGFGIVKGNEVVTVSVHRNVTLHMSREEDQERLSGKSTAGHVYNYEAIDRGEMFEGAVLGPKEELEAFKKALKYDGKVMQVSVGRSKYTQYGLCRLELGAIQPIGKADIARTGSDIYLRLDTPYIPEDGMMADAVPALQVLTNKLNEKFPESRFTMPEEKIFAAGTDIYNFVGVWKMRRPRQAALAAGSLFMVHKGAGNWTKEEVQSLHELIYGGLGERTEEGFGQMRIWHHSNMRLGDRPKPKAMKVPDGGIQSEKVRSMARQIVMNHMLEQLRLLAYEDVQKLNNLQGKGQLFATLESMLGSKEDLSQIRQNFDKALQGKLKDGKKIDSHLHGVKLRHKELYDILTSKDEAAYPYKEALFKKGTLPDSTEKLMKCLGYPMPAAEDGILFYEYWQWFFRHARKKAVQDKGAMD